jgi:hypothetical protein
VEGREQGKKLAEAIAGAKWRKAESRPGVADESGYFVAVLPEGNEPESTDLAQFDFIAHHDPETVLALYRALEAPERRLSATSGALRGYHALMGNIHSLTDNPVGSEPWRAWMDGRKKYQKKAQAALRGLDAANASRGEPGEGEGGG